MIDINSYSTSKQNGNTTSINYGSGGSGTANSLSTTHKIFGIPGNYAKRDINGDASINGTLSVIKSAQFWNDVSVSGKAFIHGDATFDKSIIVEGDASINGKLKADKLAVDSLEANTLMVQGDTTLNGNTILNGTTWANDDFRVSGDLYYQQAYGDRLSVNNLQVEGSAHFFELTIDEVKSVGGRMILTSANASIDKVEYSNGEYYCYFRKTDGDKTIKNNFVNGDQVICQTFNAKKGVSYNVDNKFYWMLCTYSSGSSTTVIDDKEYYYIKLSGSDKSQYTNAVPEAGDKIAQLGNRNNGSAAIIMSAYDNAYLDPTIKAPSIVQYANINDYYLTNKRVTVISPDKNQFTGSFTLKNSDGTNTSLEDYIESNADSKSPFIGDGNNGTVAGYWYVWDKNSKTYVNSGVLAEGQNGIGIDGADGADGKSSYIHLAWTDSLAPNWTNFSIGNSMGRGYNFLGTYVDSVEEDSTDPTKYDWAYIRGVDGSTGEKGTDGRFTHIAWATKVGTNASDFQGFTISKTAGAEYPYIGTCIDSNLNDPTNPLVYNWVYIKGDRGEKGDVGAIPYVGSNGNWWIDGKDTGWSASGDDGHSPYVDPATNTWWEWDAENQRYHDTGVQATGDKGEKGDKGDKGEMGDSIKVLGTLDSSSKLPSRGNIGDAYLINGEMWVWDGLRWQNVGSIQGPAGTSNYIHVAWMNTLGNTDNSFTYENPLGVNYKYMGTCVNDSEEDSTDYRDYKWVCIVGQTGPEPLVADFDDEMIQIPCDSDGTYNANWSWTNHVYLRRGGVDIDVASYNVTADGLTTSNSKSGNTVTITSTKPTKDICKLTVVCTDKDGNSATATATAFKVKDGADGKSTPIYQIVPSSDSISTDSKGDYNPVGVGCSVTKSFEGNFTTISDLSAEGLSISAYSDGTSISFTYGRQIILSEVKPTTSIRFDLKKNGTLIDRETLNVIKDGKDGTSVNIKGTKTNSSQLPTSGNYVGDAYIIDGEMWIWEGKQWVNAGSIQGPEGTTYYYHIAYANSTNGLNFTTSDNPNFVEGTKYKYMGTCTNDVQADPDDYRQYKWICIAGDDGASGEDALIADFDDEMTQVVVDSNGKLPSNWSWSTVCRLRKGSEQVSVKYFTITQDGLTTTSSITEGTVRLTVTNMSKDVGKASVICKDKDGNAATATVTVTKVYSGTDGVSPVIYQIVTSENAIKRNGSQYDPSSVSCSVTKNVDNNLTTLSNLSAEGITVKAYTDGTYRGTYSSIALANYKPQTSVKFTIEKGGVVCDEETIPVVSDGTNGTNGTSNVYADLDNEMDSIICDMDGNFNGTFNLYTNVAIYAGLEKLTPKSVTFSSVTGVSSSYSNGKCTFGVTKSVADKANVEITIKADFQSVEYTRKLTFTINKIKEGVPGTSAIMYSLLPSVGAVKKDGSGSYSVSTINCKIVKTEGDSATELSSYPQNLYMKYKKDDGDFTPLSVYGSDISTSGVKSMITFALYRDSGVMLDIETIPIVSDGYKGVDGETLVIADMDNEMDSVIADKNGNFSGTITLYTNVSMYRGLTSLDITSCTCSSHTGLTSSYSNGKITFTVNQNIADRTDVTITLKASFNSENYTRYLHFTINKIKGGKDGVDGTSPTIYSLAPSISQIKINSDGNYQQPNIICRVNQTTAGTTTAVTSLPNGWSIEVKKDSGSETSYTLGSSYSTQGVTSSVTFYLYSGSTLIDSENIPVVKDGTNGKDGTDGTTSYMADFDDEFETVACDANGNVIDSNWSWSPNLFMYYGKDKVTPYKVIKETTNITASNPSKNSDGSWKITLTKPTADSCKCKATAYYKDSTGAEHTAMAIANIAKVKAGADGQLPTLYRIVTSVNAVKKNGTTYNPNEITVTAQKVVGTTITNLSTTSAISNEGLKLVAYVDSVSSHYTLTNTLKSSLTVPLGSSYKPNTYMKFELQDSKSNVWDYETIPVVSDGAKGDNGDKGDKGENGSGADAEMYSIRIDKGAVEMNASGDIKTNIAIGVNYTKGNSTSAINIPSAYTCIMRFSDRDGLYYSNDITITKNTSQFTNKTTYSISNFGSTGFGSKAQQRNCCVCIITLKDGSKVMDVCQIPILLEKGYIYEIDEDLNEMLLKFQDYKTIKDASSDMKTITNRFSKIDASVSGISSTVSKHTTTLDGLGKTYATKTELSEINQTATNIGAWVKVIDGSIGKLTETGIDIANKKITMKADNFVLKNNSGTQVLGVNSSGDLEMTGKITATSGKIAGMKVDGNALTNAGFDNDAYIILRNDTRKAFVGFGGNVLPASTGTRAVARIENNDTKTDIFDDKNYALILSASGKTYNHAFSGKGNGTLNGVIEGYKLNEFTPTSAQNVILLHDGKYVAVKCTSSSYTTVYLPYKSEVVKTLGIGTYDHFAVEMTIVGSRSNSYTFRVYGRRSGSSSELPYFLDPDECQTDLNVAMAKGDTIKVLLTYDGSYYNAYLLSHLD